MVSRRVQAALDDVPRVGAGMGMFGFLVGAGMAALGQLVPPFHVPTHELIQAFAGVAALVQLQLAAVSLRAFPLRQDRLEAAFLSSLGGVLGLGLGLQCVAWVANALAYGCDTQGAGLFLWLTWAPLGLLATVLGLGMAAWRLVSRALAFIGLVVVCVAHDQLRLDLGLAMADPMLGFVTAFDQRAPIEVSAVQALQRVWLVGVALAAWSVLIWSHHRDSGRGGLAAAASVAMLALTLAFGGQLGMGLGRGAKRVLDGTLRTAHVEVAFDQSGVARHRVRRIARESEWVLHRLAKRWGVSLDGVTVTLDVYDSPGALERATGRRFAHAGSRRAAISWRDAFGNSLRHELVHAIDGLAGKPVWQMDPSRGRVEGSAVAWSEGYAEVDVAHAAMAIALERGRLPHADQFMSLSGFWSLPEGTAYRASGSFVGFLIRRHGVAAWRTWLRTQRAEAAFGADLAELDAEWRAYLAGLPVDERAARQSDRMFDPRYNRSATSQTCPKLGLRVPASAADADGARYAGDHVRALELYRSLHRETQEPSYWWSIIGELLVLERYDEVLSALSRADPDEMGALRILDTRIDALTALGDVESLAGAIDARLALRANGRLAAFRGLIEHADLPRHVLLELFPRHPEGWSVARATLERLRGSDPQHAEAFAVLASSLLVDVPHGSRDSMVLPAQRQVVKEALAWLRQVPASCDAGGENWAEVAHTLLQLEDCALAEELIDVLDAHCTDPLVHWRVQLARERLAWESTPEEGIPKACSL